MLLIRSPGASRSPGYCPARLSLMVTFKSGSFLLASAIARHFSLKIGETTSPSLSLIAQRNEGGRQRRVRSASRPCRRFDYGLAEKLHMILTGIKEACRRRRAGRAYHHGEDRARADLQARPAPTGRRGGLDREVPPALGCTLRSAGQNCRGPETGGDIRWTQEEVSLRTARRWNGSPSVRS